MTHDSAVAIAKKLKALAEKATAPGECAAAAKKLREFCGKHGLDDAEYDIETVKVSISYTNAQEKTLLSAVMCMVLETDAVKGTDENGVLTFRCTHRKFEDITDAFDYYKKIYYDYVDGVMSSLITKNRIVNKKPSKPEFRMDEMTEDERKAYEDAVQKASPPRMDQSGQTEPPKSVPTPPPTDDETCKGRKDDRVRRVFMVMEETPWVKKVRAKLFLR